MKNTSHRNGFTQPSPFPYAAEVFFNCCFRQRLHAHRVSGVICHVRSSYLNTMSPPQGPEKRGEAIKGRSVALGDPGIHGPAPCTQTRSVTAHGAVWPSLRLLEDCNLRNPLCSRNVCVGDPGRLSVCMCVYVCVCVCVCVCTYVYVCVCVRLIHDVDSSPLCAIRYAVGLGQQAADPLNLRDE